MPLFSLLAFVLGTCTGLFRLGFWQSMVNQQLAQQHCVNQSPVAGLREASLLLQLRRQGVSADP